MLHGLPACLSGAAYMPKNISVFAICLDSVDRLKRLNGLICYCLFALLKLPFPCSCETAVISLLYLASDLKKLEKCNPAMKTDLSSYTEFDTSVI